MSPLKALATIATTLLTATSVWGQGLPLDHRPVRIELDSIWVENNGAEYSVVYSEVVEVADAASLRLRFREVVLGESSGAPTMLRLTSLQDGGQQRLLAHHVEEWGRTTAFFNGGMVLVELLASPGAAPSRIVLDTAVIAPIEPIDPNPDAPMTICGAVDDRVQSFDPRCARIVTSGGAVLSCTAWLFADLNGGFLTAGHCGPSANDIVEFNVPLSNATCGSLNHPSPDHQYAVDPASVQGHSGGTGNDWSYFGCFANPNTGLFPRQAQELDPDWAGPHALAGAAPAVNGQTIRITGYGSVTAALLPCTLYGVQKTHTGPYVSLSGNQVRYAVDTTGGNSGSAVVDLSTGLAIGIHTSGFCSISGGSNLGTAIHHPSLQAALANPTGVLAPFSVTPAGAAEHEGDIGGPFSNPSIVYTLTNTTTGPIDFVVATGPLLLLNGTDQPVSGSLAQGASVNLTADLAPATTQLAAGTYLEAVTFSDTTHGAATQRDHFLDIGLMTYASSDTPLAIPDGEPGGVTSTITVPGGLGPGPQIMIEDLNVGLDVSHVWIGDLIVTLAHNGVSATIVDRPGYTGVGFGCGANHLIDIVLDDEGSGGMIEDQCIDNLTSPPGYVPNDPLSVFDGMDPSGDWTLTVVDAASSFAGTLESWTLVITPGYCPADLNADAVVNVLDLLAMLGAWGDNPGNPADLNADGVVNVLDLLLLIGAWGSC